MAACPKQERRVGDGQAIISTAICRLLLAAKKEKKGKKETGDSGVL